MPPWIDDERQDMYCPVCGVTINARSSRHNWLESSKVLTTGHITVDDSRTFHLERYRLKQSTDPSLTADEKYPASFGQPMPYRMSTEHPLEVHVFDATSNGSSTFHVINAEEHVTVNYINQSPLRTPKNREYGGTLHFPLHAACFEIIERFIAAQETQKGNNRDKKAVHDIQISENKPISSLIDLWSLLLSRIEVGGLELSKDRPHYMPAEPHGFFIPEGVRGVRWEDCCQDGGELFTSDSIKIPKMTIDILSNLTVNQPSDAATKASATTAFTTYFTATPPEIQSEILNEFCKILQDAPLETTNLLPQAWWRDSLTSGNIFPWLWDIDAREVVDKEAEAAKRNIAWDWELLVRKLSHASIGRLGDRMLKLPPGLRNRRRIRQLVDVARPGDLRLDLVLSDAKDAWRGSFSRPRGLMAGIPLGFFPNIFH